MRQRMWQFIYIAFLVSTFGEVLAEPIKYPKPVEQIAKNFPDSIYAKIQGYEFCPDNTCDAFVAKHEFLPDEVGDFIYLYVYYFSDYYVLKNWRLQDEAKKVALDILAKPIYEKCINIKQVEAARCVLRRVGEKSDIKIYSVRYDEAGRNAIIKEIP